MERKRLCDLCEKQPIELSFHDYLDLENFDKYGLLPAAFTLFLDKKRLVARGGKVLYLWLLGTSVVVCEQCLSLRSEDAIVSQIVEKPRIIEEALTGFNRAIAEDERSLFEKENDLKFLEAWLAKTKKDIENRKKYLARQIKRRNELWEKRKNINLTREQVVILLSKILQNRL